MRENPYLEDSGVDKSIILRWIFSYWCVRPWAVSIWLSIGQMLVTCKCGNVFSVSVKCGEFLE
jgi:hypothetical protein